MHIHRIISKLVSPISKQVSEIVKKRAIYTAASFAKLPLTTFLLAVMSISTVCTLGPATTLQAQSYKPSLFSKLHWRSVGPLRGGRMHALDAAPGKPTAFYAGADNGGIWKSTDYGNSWKPIFDKQATGSIGSIAVAPSDPNIIYVGSGAGIVRPDQALGNGMYKSTDAGKSWTYLGMRQTQMINKVIVDPNNPDRLFIAAMGHLYGPNEQRGIFRSTDGGKTFQKVLYADKYTSGDDVDFDPNNPQILYATMWQQQEAPWENGSFGGTSGGVYKSTDGGDTWEPLTKGLPKDATQILLDIAPSDPNRIYASVATGRRVGLYRSDDAGSSWRKITDDSRPAARVGGGDLPVLVVDPNNEDVIYSCSSVMWKSTDGGKKWTAIRGGIGGDDYQRLWIDPNDSNILFTVSDQGAIISVNKGETWSSWYNQPTAAMYDVATDNSFPYRVCGGQQDSGSACVRSRSNDGQITAHDWHPVGVVEYGRAAPDPLNPDLVYGGRVSRYDRKTGQIQNIGPPTDGDYRILRTMPLRFSPADPHALFFASNTVWVTRSGGNQWTKISPDLTRKGKWDVPDILGKYTKTVKDDSKNRAVVYALGLSPLDINTIWAGTDDGLIQLTTDGGKNWKNVTPPEMKPWWAVYGMEASHFDKGTAYAAINTMQLDDQRPHLFRTRDFGKTWKQITKGIPDSSATNVIIEDPKQKGLLFAGTEGKVYVSFDDGDNWQSLRLNMPVISIRDLEIKDNDLVAATHGRGFQILDDITPLRQINEKTASAKVTLFKPGLATRVRWGMNPPTSWRMPWMKNPPPGAIIDYYLGENVKGPVSLDILDANGDLVRHFSSEHPSFEPIPEEELRYPTYWPRLPQQLSTKAGHHRYVWDMHYAPIPGLANNLDADQAVRDNETPKIATAPWILPGNYTIKLTVEGKTYTQPLKVRMDPRVKTPEPDLRKQFGISKRAYDETVAGLEALGKIRDLQKQLKQRSEKAKASKAIKDYQKQLDKLAGPSDAGPYFFYSYSGSPVLSGVAFKLRRLMGQIQNADQAPTKSQEEDFNQANKQMQTLLNRWDSLKGKKLGMLNTKLRTLDMAAVKIWEDAPVPQNWDIAWIKYYRADM